MPGGRLRLGGRVGCSWFGTEVEGWRFLGDIARIVEGPAVELVQGTMLERMVADIELDRSAAVAAHVVQAEHIDQTDYMDQTDYIDPVGRTVAAAEVAAVALVSTSDTPGSPAAQYLQLWR